MANDNKQYYVEIDNIHEVVLRPPRIDWSEIKDRLNEGMKLWFPINKKTASYGRRRIKELSGIGNGDLISFNGKLEGDNRDGYFFVLHKTLIKENKIK